ncbi:MAG: hypothetical protein ACKO0Z_27780 [Betaproteobacteria bacterium]
MITAEPEDIGNDGIGGCTYNTNGWRSSAGLLKANDIPKDVLFPFLAALGIHEEQAKRCDKIVIEMNWREAGCGLVKVRTDRFCEPIVKPQ